MATRGVQWWVMLAASRVGAVTERETRGGAVVVSVLSCLQVCLEVPMAWDCVGSWLSRSKAKKRDLSWK